MGVPRPTEMAVRHLLQKELEKRGVKVNPEVSFVTPVGRMMPDIVLQNGGDYVVETKLGAEAKLFDALIRLYDYSKYTEARGAFAILFPEELRRPWPYEMIERIAADPKLSYKAAALFKDLRPTQQFAGNLSQMADWIASHVLRPPVVEADTSLAIRVLSNAVDFITLSIRQLGGKELEDIFGGETVFENILQYEEGKYPLEEMHKAATYLLINQILFYHVLSSVDMRYPAIDETKIRRPGDLAMYFREVLKIDYSSTFGFDVASRLPDSATDMVRKVIKVIDALAPEKIRHDVLGKVFHELIPFEIRKAVAAFYTNNEAAEILAHLAIDNPNAKVIDLAVGSGTLLVASHRRKRDLLLKSKGAFELEDHKRFLEQDLTGIDIMPFAAHLAVVHLSLQALLTGHETERVRIAVWDSTKLRPGQVIPAVSRELRAAYRRPTLDMFKEGPPSFEKAYVKRGALTLEGLGGEEIPLEQADVVIMNPPFTRQERLPREYKDALDNRLKEYKDRLHGQLGLYGYFIFLADRFLRPSGRLALVLPATVLRIASTQGIRDLLTESYDIEYIITTYQRSAFSEGARLREILLVAKKRETIAPEKKSNPCLIATLNKLPRDLAEARSYTEYFKGLNRRQVGKIENEYSTVIITKQENLKENRDNLFRLIATTEPHLVDLWRNLKAREELTELSTYLDDEERLIRGFEMTLPGISPVSAYTTFIIRDPSRALKKHDQWIVKNLDGKEVIAENRFTHISEKIPRRVVAHALRRLSGVKKIDVSGTLDFMVTKPFKNWRVFFGTESVISNSLSKWREYVESRRTNLVFMRRFNMSAPQTINLSFYSQKIFVASKLMWCFRDVPREEAEILCLWFNSSLNILQLLLNRIETEGAFMSFPKYVLLAIFILNPKRLNKRQRGQLQETYKEVSVAKFPSLMKQLEQGHPTRKKIDRAILKVLGFEDKEIEGLLGYLYPALANEIEKLKTLMKG